MKAGFIYAGFAAFLVAAGLTGWAASGFEDRARTAVISGSVCGAIMLVCGLVILFGRAGAKKVAYWAGLGLALFFGATFTWRATVGWGAVLEGNRDKLFVSLLLTVMVGGALVTAVLALRAPPRPAV